jgi:hypothetical protein
LLRRQLERRFGALPGWDLDRIAAADTAALEDWGLRVLDAGSLDDRGGRLHRYSVSPSISGSPAG